MFNPFKYRSRMQARKDSFYVLNIKRLMRGEQFNSPMNNLEQEVRIEAELDFLLFCNRAHHLTPPPRKEPHD